MSASAPLLHGRMLARNTLLNVLGFGLPLLLALAAIPAVVAGLGADRFGVLALAWMAFSYLGALGFGSASTRFVAGALGRPGGSERVAGIVWSAAALQLAVGVAAGVALYGSAPLLAEGVLRMPETLVPEAVSCFRLLAAAVPVVLVAAAFSGVLQARQRFGLINAVQAPASAANFLLPLVGILLGWSLPGILALLLGSRVAVALCYFVLAARLEPSLLRGPLGGAAAELRHVAAFGGWASVSGVISPALTYLDRLALGALVSVAAVAYYAAPFEVVWRLVLVPASLVATLYPAFSVLAVGSDPARLERLAARGVKYVMVALAPAAVLLVAGGHDLLRVWLGPEFAEHGALALRILAVGVLVNGLAQIVFSLIQALGRPDLTARLHLVELPLYAVVVWFCVTRWGIPGAALAWTLRVSFDAAVLFIMSARLVPGFGAALARAGAGRAAVLAGLALGGAGLVAGVDAPGARLVLVGGLIVATALGLWRYALGAADRDDLLRMVRPAAA